jgi:hypothetical protein
MFFFPQICEWTDGPVGGGAQTHLSQAESSSLAPSSLARLTLEFLAGKIKFFGGKRSKQILAGKNSTFFGGSLNFVAAKHFF